MPAMPAKKHIRTIFSCYSTPEIVSRLREASVLTGVPMATIANRLLVKWLDGDINISTLPKSPLK